LGLCVGGAWLVVSILHLPGTTKAHSIRHLMTGTGAYYYIVWGVWLRHCLNYKQDEYELVWPNFWTMPDVVKRQDAVANGRSTKKEL
jgi:dihydroceramidase